VEDAEPNVFVVSLQAWFMLGQRRKSLVRPRYRRNNNNIKIVLKMEEEGTDMMNLI